MGNDEAEVGTIEGRINFCPRCRKPVEARDFMDPFYLGALDSMLPQMHCSCGYSGLPISLSRRDYIAWARGSARPGKR